MNDRQIERVARAICLEAATSIVPECSTCVDGKCTLWYVFKKEAIAAGKAMKGY